MDGGLNTATLHRYKYFLCYSLNNSMNWKKNFLRFRTVKYTERIENVETNVKYEEKHFTSEYKRQPKVLFTLKKQIFRKINILA